MFGEPDPITGKNNYRLWVCFNNRCHLNHENSQRLQAYAAIPLGRRAILPPAATVTSEASTSSPTQAVVAPPPPGMLLDALPPTHPAISYLVNRGFDPGVLAQCWGVGYCQHSPDHGYIANERIIIPIWSYARAFATRDNLGPLMLAGWQSRAIGDGDGREKYLNAPGMKKSEQLYGLPWATNNSSPVWICEGVTDCWKVGPGAVAIFGKSLSQHQKLLIVHHFAGRPIVVLLDRDASREAQEICQQLQRARGLSEGDRRVIVLDVPAGHNDPGECTQAEIWEATARALATPPGNGGGPISRPAIANEAPRA
jgi:hypothetical protein